MISCSNQRIAGIFYLKAWDTVKNLMSDVSVILEEKSYDYEWASSPSHCNGDYIYITSWKQKVQLALSQAILVRIHYTYWDKHRNFVFPSFLYFFFRYENPDILSPGSPKAPVNFVQTMDIFSTCENQLLPRDWKHKSEVPCF